MPRGWRIARSNRVARAFDGEGARIYGGRWNSPGTPVVYTAQSESLAALELLVHLHSSELLTSYSAIPVDFDDDLVEVLPPAKLPRNWSAHPAPSALQQIGDRWAAAGRSLVLQVPSAIVPREHNYLLNPIHPDFRRVVIGRASRFRFDPRLR